MSTAAVEARFRLEVGGGSSERFLLAVELSLEQGVMALFGPSGAGKSLTLAAIAGLRPIAAGRVCIAGRVVDDLASGVWVAPEHRGIGYVPQHSSLFPFCDVEQNVAFSLPRVRRRNDPQVQQLMEELGIHHLRAARPAVLSGGERQRVALARALAAQPGLLLLDEPFAFVDPAGRAELRGLLRDILERRQLPALVVTHSREEAVGLAHQALQFERGRSLRQGAVKELLRG
ncbi:MAG: ABC transporter ATP-binding protein [Rickettsiales bacterium]|nr:ABC transporter ATP-binding protein [Rickettsiales bacterium]|tara:strand:+ start:448 stop:1140 length:693 start_codon:yes stop_codon:yes gene_type:complete